MSAANTRVMLTGGTGFLGSQLAHALVAHGYDVVLLKRSFSRVDRVADILPAVRCHDLDREDLGGIVRQCTPDVILHCATDYGRKDSDPLRIIEANLVLPLKLLCVTREMTPPPMFVNTDTILDKRVSAYSLSKEQCKDWLQRFADERVCVNVALEHFYGPGDDPTKFVTYVIQSLVRNEPRIALTKGEQTRDFIFISDVVTAFLTILRAAAEWQRGFYPFEVGSNQPVTVRTMVELAKELAGNTVTSLDFGALPYRPNEVMEAHVDTTRLRALGWRCQTDLRTGLHKTIIAEQQRQKQ